MIELKDKRILVTGGTGMIGSAITQELQSRGIHAYPISSKYNLCDKEQADYVCRFFNPDIVIHCAVHNGGIVYNQTNPADLFDQISSITVNMMRSAHKYHVEKFLNLTSVCSYPKGLDVFTESEFSNGPPDESVEYFGLAKRMGEAYGRALYKQYGFKVITACMTNAYGLKDRFGERGKVTGMLIAKFCKAVKNGDEEVICLGDGSPVREFLYTKDAAKLLIKMLEVYDDPTEVLNIGTHNRMTIRTLAEYIAELTGFSGKIVWDTKSINGQQNRHMDLTKMNKVLGPFIETPFREGLQEAIDYYKENY